MVVQLLYLFASALIAYIVYRWSRGSSLPKLRGPQPELFFGNVRHVMQRSNVDVMLEWQEQFGSVFRFKSLFGLDKVIVADPKALHHILNVAAYEFPQPGALRAVITTMCGPNLVWAEGETHKKQRRIMLPAFGVREVKSFFPVFKSCAERLVNEWKDAATETGDNESTIIDIHHSILPATLNALCGAAFDFQTDSKNGDELKKLYSNFNNDAFPPNAAILTALLDFIPAWIVRPLLNILPAKNIVFIRKHKKKTYDVAEDLVKEKSHAFMEGKGGKDVFSLLVNANITEKDKKFQLTRDELCAQTSALFIAGHDTTAGTLTFALWQLAKHIDVQNRLRDEIRQAQEAARARGKAELTVDDMENMVYLQAVLKETLRLHPSVFQIARSAAKDAVLPLSRPIKTASGEIIEQLPVSKGTDIMVAIGCYNQNKEVWGDDAREFNPDRWLTGDQAAKQDTSVGVIGNILSFLSGTRSCIGWRFAMIEMECFLVEIIDQFELRLADPKKNMRPWGDNLMYPLVDGEEEKGAQMPLRVSIAPRD